MKKLFALLLAAVMALSLVACGGNDTKTDEPSGDQAAEITSALNLLETVWNDYSDDEKFSVVGGGPDAEQMVDGAPGDGGGGRCRVPDPHAERQHLHRRGLSCVR